MFRTAIGLLALLALVTPGWARMVTIEGASTLTDTSEASVDRAFEQAIATCLKTAREMGLTWVKFDRVTLKGDRVVVEMLAADNEEDTRGERSRENRPSQ